MKLNEFCPSCQQTTASRMVSHPSGLEFLCVECGTQVDFLHDQHPEDFLEPTGSCEECGCHLYDKLDNGGVCDTCQIYAWSAANDDNDGWVIV